MTIRSCIRRRFQKKSYIRLSDIETRKVLFQLNLWKTADQFNWWTIWWSYRKNWWLYWNWYCYFNQDTIYEPIRKCESVTLFMRVNKDGNGRCIFSLCPITMKNHDMSNLEMFLPIDICYKYYILSLKKELKILLMKRILLENSDKKVKETLFFSINWFL